MKNPFPGMDPYLENHWGDVHTTLLIYARNQIQGNLPKDLKARVEEDLKVDESASEPSFRPDVSVWESPRTRGPGVRTAEPGHGPGLTQPVIAFADPKPRRRLCITDTSGILVTAIEFLSPTNKRGRGAVSYQKKREELMNSGVNLMEVDLVRKGGLVVRLFEEDERFEDSLKRRFQKLPLYMVNVFDAQNPSAREMYPIFLQDRLPVCRVPLRPADSLVALDLQPLVDQCYQDSDYSDIDYQQAPAPPLDPEDDAWMDAMLKDKGLR